MKEGFGMLGFHDLNSEWESIGLSTYDLWTLPEKDNLVKSKWTIFSRPCRISRRQKRKGSELQVKVKVSKFEMIRIYRPVGEVDDIKRNVSSLAFLYKWILYKWISRNFNRDLFFFSSVKYKLNDWTRVYRGVLLILL